MSYISSDLADLSGEQALMGRSVFVGDIRLPGMLYGCLLGSPQARGMISGVDVKEALKAPGVVAAISGQGLLKEQVDYLGQPVAAVCAESADAAAYAICRVKYTFDGLEPVFDIDQALAEGAVALLERGNVVLQGVHEKGDVENALPLSEQVVMARFQVAPKALAGLEPAACIAGHEPGGGLVLYTNRGQEPEQSAILAGALGINEAMLRVVCIGAAAAGPWETAMQYAALSLAAKTGRAVKFAPTLAEDVSYGQHLPGTVILGRAGVDNSGRIKALDLDVSVDGGANTVELEQAVAMAGALLYAPDNFRCRIRQVFTNNPPAHIAASCAAAQVQFAVEGLLNESARQLSIDPLELRLANLELGGRLAQCISLAKQSELWDGGKQTGAACFAWGATETEPCPGVQLVRADVDSETGMVSPSIMHTVVGCGNLVDAVSARSHVLAQIQQGVATAMISGLKMIEGKALNAAYKRLPNSLDMPPVELSFCCDGGALEIGDGPSFGVAPAVAASVAAVSGGVCTELPITPEGLLRALGRIR